MTATAPATALDGALEGALEGALAEVGAERERWQVPGLELAVVRGREPLFAGGFGVRGVVDPAPVGASTLFHHGSCGKAYTGLLAALLAHDGLVDLDAPVRHHVPELRLPDPVVAERVTIRDLVSHRSGLGRHDLVWILDSSVSREELVRRLEHLPMGGDLRGQMLYSNFGFALAGLALGRAAGTTWEELLRQRLLEPLGMTRTFSAGADIRSDADHAKPHLVRDGSAVPTQFRIMQGIAPAGELLSCADDSVTWLRAHLGLQPDVPAGAVAAAQQPQMLVPAGMSPFPEIKFVGYAMGWLVGTFRGHKLVWHNGGVDGFLTQTLLLPEQQIGVIASANAHMSNFPFAVVLDVADALLGTVPGEQSWYDRMRPEPHVAEADVVDVPTQPAPTPPPAHPLPDYSGSYRHDGYGALTVAVGGGGLRVRVGDSDLGATHRHYETWDLRYEPLDATFPVTFVTGAAGTVDAAVVEFDGEAPVRFAKRGEES